MEVPPDCRGNPFPHPDSANILPGRLVHLPDQTVDVLLPVTQITALDEMPELASSESTGRVAELEWPEEVRRLLEVGSDGDDLVDQVFHADDAEFAQVLLDERVVRQRDALLLDLSVATLVDELAHGLEVGESVGNPRLDDFEHLQGGLGQADEDTVVDLEETQELEDLARLGGNLVDTVFMTGQSPFVIQYRRRFPDGCECLPLDTDDKDQLGLGRDVEGVLLFTQAAEADLLPLCVSVFLDILLGTLEDDAALLLGSL